MNLFNIIVGKELFKLLLKRQQIEQIEQGKIKNKDVYIIMFYHQLIQNGGLLPVLIPLAGAIDKSVLTMVQLH